MKKILIIEDDRDHATLYGDILKKAGFSVDIVTDGVEGEKKIRADGQDIVILDIILPKVDGMTVLKNLKEHPPEKKVGPIILLTNLGDEHVAKEGLKHGADRFLMKAELEPDDLVKEVRSLLGKKR